MRYAPRFGERGSGAGGRNIPALARLHSGGSLNRSHAFAAEGGGSFTATLWHVHSTDTSGKVKSPNIMLGQFATANPNADMSSSFKFRARSGGIVRDGEAGEGAYGCLLPHNSTNKQRRFYGKNK